MKSVKKEKEERHKKQGEKREKKIYPELVIYKAHECKVASVVFNSVQVYGLQLARLLCPWDSPEENPGVSCHAFLQGIFLTQGLNPYLLCLLHWQVGFFYHQYHLGSPIYKVIEDKLKYSSFFNFNSHSNISHYQYVFISHYNCQRICCNYDMKVVFPDKVQC